MQTKTIFWGILRREMPKGSWEATNRVFDDVEKALATEKELNKQNNNIEYVAVKIESVE